MSEGNGKPKGLTSIQSEILKKLSDGKEHYSEELRQCLDIYSEPNTFHVHLSGIRRHLEREGKVALISYRRGPGNVVYALVPLVFTSPSV